MRALSAVKAVAVASVLAPSPASAFKDLDVTAKYVMAHMKPEERFPYISGVDMYVGALSGFLERCSPKDIDSELGRSLSAFYEARSGDDYAGTFGQTI